MTSDVALRDGSTVHVRSAELSDVEPLAAFLDALSPQARWFRFLAAVDAGAAARVLLERGVGLLATTGPAGAIVAHACYVPEATGRAELAFEVADAWQGHGRATLLLAQLAEVAEAAGIATLTATIHPANHRMLHVFRDSGFAIEVSSEPGELHIRMPSGLGREARERFEERDAIAAVAAVRHVLEPASIAVVGASGRHDSVGGAVLRNILSAGFTGPVYAVNRHVGRVAGFARVRVACRRAGARRAGGDRGRRRCRARRGARLRDCATARRPACERSSFCRPASARPDARGVLARRRCLASAAMAACGWSAPTASAC